MAKTSAGTRLGSITKLIAAVALSITGLGVVLGVFLEARWGWLSVLGLGLLGFGVLLELRAAAALDATRYRNLTARLIKLEEGLNGVAKHNALELEELGRQARHLRSRAERSEGLLGRIDATARRHEALSKENASKAAESWADIRALVAGVPLAWVRAVEGLFPGVPEVIAVVGPEDGVERLRRALPARLSGAIVPVSLRGPDAFPAGWDGLIVIDEGAGAELPREWLAWMPKKAEKVLLTKPGVPVSPRVAYRGFNEQSLALGVAHLGDGVHRILPLLSREY